MERLEADVYNVYGEEQDSSEYQEMYNNYLDEMYGDVIMGDFMFSAHKVMAEMEPVGYRSEFHNYMDSLYRNAHPSMRDDDPELVFGSPEDAEEFRRDNEYDLE